MTRTIDGKTAGEWSAKGHDLYNLRIYGEAIKCLDRSLEIDSECDIAWNVKGNAFHMLSKYEEAIRCYDKTLAIYEEWIRSIGKKMGLNPGHASAWYGKGCALGSLTRYEEAIWCFDKVLEMGPRFSSCFESAKSNRTIVEAKLREQQFKTSPPSQLETVSPTPTSPPPTNSHLTIGRTIYDPTTQDFIISTPRPLPNVRNRIERSDPGMHWLVVCVNNNTDRPIDEWGIEIETPSTLRILEAGIEGSDQRFSLIASSPKPWLTNWSLGISHHLGIVVPRGGSKRIYFKLASDACSTSYSVTGKVSAEEYELPLEEKRFRFSCDQATLKTAIRADPKKAQELTRVIHPNRPYLVPLQAFRILQGLEQCCRLGEYEDVKEKMRTLLNLLEGAQVGEGLIRMVREHYEVIKRLSEGSPDFGRRIGTLCGNFADKWIVEVFKG